MWPTCRRRISFVEFKILHNTGIVHLESNMKHFFPSLKFLVVSTSTWTFGANWKDPTRCLKSLLLEHLLRQLYSNEKLLQDWLIGVCVKVWTSFTAPVQFPSAASSVTVFFFFLSPWPAEWPLLHPPVTNLNHLHNDLSVPTLNLWPHNEPMLLLLILFFFPGLPLLQNDFFFWTQRHGRLLSLVNPCYFLTTALGRFQ